MVFISLFHHFCSYLESLRKTTLLILYKHTEDTDDDAVTHQLDVKWRWMLVRTPSPKDTGEGKWQMIKLEMRVWEEKEKKKSMKQVGRHEGGNIDGCVYGRKEAILARDASGKHKNITVYIYIECRWEKANPERMLVADRHNIAKTNITRAKGIGRICYWYTENK